MQNNYLIIGHYNYNYSLTRLHFLKYKNKAGKLLEDLTRENVSSTHIPALNSSNNILSHHSKKIYHVLEQFYQY